MVQLQSTSFGKWLYGEEELSLYQKESEVSPFTVSFLPVV